MLNKIKWMILAIVLITACQNDSKKKPSEMTSKTNTETSKLVGSWVQPNPINEKEVQGFSLHKDGTAESINMNTLKYKNWWVESDTLNLVVESIGNGLTFIDTSKFEVAKINDQELDKTANNNQLEGFIGVVISQHQE